MKKLLIIAIAGLLFASCEKDEKEKTESDIIVKEYGEDYMLTLASRISDTLYLDINDDEKNDVLVYMQQVSGMGVVKSFVPLSTNVVICGLERSMLMGSVINDTICWEKGMTYWWDGMNETDWKYLAIKFETDTSVNYGWILPTVIQYSNYYEQAMSIVKTAYCKTNGKTIFAGQEE